MLSKRFYDIFSILLIIFFIGSIYYSNQVYSNVLMEKWEASDKSNMVEITLDVESDSRVLFANYLYLFVKILFGAYWLLVLILSIQFYKRELASMLDVIIIALLVPLAILFYLITLRGKYKKL